MRVGAELAPPPNRRNPTLLQAANNCTDKTHLQRCSRQAILPASRKSVRFNLRNIAPPYGKTIAAPATIVQDHPSLMLLGERREDAA